MMKLNLKKLKAISLESNGVYNSKGECVLDTAVIEAMIEALEEAVKLARDVQAGLVSSKDIVSRSLVKTGDFTKFLERFDE